MMNFSEPVWRNDAATRQWKKRHENDLEKNVKDMDECFLGEALTFCEGFGNPFVKELLERAGLLEEFEEAKTNIARSKILDKAGDKFGIMFF